MSKVPLTDHDITIVDKNQDWKWLARGENGKPRKMAGPRGGRGGKSTYKTRIKKNPAGKANFKISLLMSTLVYLKQCSS